MNTFTRKRLALLLFCTFVIFSSYSHASDSVASIFTTQSATDTGSNGSLISVDSSLSYINKGENSSIIGNYFSGYYYDSVLGYFEVDMSVNPSENVRIVGSTGKCISDYGYKLGGYGYSEAFGYIDFDYNSEIFVYYCIADELLYGYAYNEMLGFQNFEGITFDIEVDATLLPTESPTGTGIFINDDTEIFDETDDNGESNSNSNSNTSNFNYDSIQNDFLEFDGKYESLFYIIK